MTQGTAPLDEAPAPPRRGMLRRVGDPWPWALAVVTAIGCGVFLAVSLSYTQGHLIPPLDDVYIHLQYARGIGEGSFFRYNPGDPISTGASSFLYPLLLAPAWALGIHGTAFLGAAVAFGVVCASITSACVYLLGRELGGQWVGAGAGLLTATSGPFLWGAVSGMEVALVAVLLTGSLLALVRGSRWAPVLLVLLALARPEGLIMAVALGAATAWTTRTRRGVLTLAAPLVAGAGQLLFYQLATGSPRANGLRSKSISSLGYPFPAENLGQTLGNVGRIVSVLTGFASQDFLPPGALLLALLCLTHLAVTSPRWRPLAIAVGLGTAGVVVGISTLWTALWQDGRYLQPFVPLLLLLLAGGLHVLAGALPDRRQRRTALAAGLVVVALFSLLALPSWALRLGQQAATIREAPVSVANWLRGHVPPGETIAVNDVGATAWFSGHRIVDLVGLTTNGLAEPANQGSGALFEALRDMPPGQRPDWFSIYDQWSGFPVNELHDSGLLGDRPVMSFTLRSPVHATGALPPPCQSDRSCPTVNIWRADWSVAGTGDRPDAPVPGTIRDHVNVGSRSDEARHGWVYRPALVGSGGSTVLARQDQIADSGRQVVGGESFRLSGLTPGRAVTLTARVKTREPAAEATIGSHDVAVRAGGRDLGVWHLPVDGAARWTQAQFVLPAEAVTAPTVDVDLGPVTPLLAPFPDYTSFGYWASQ